MVFNSPVSYGNISFIVLHVGRDDCDDDWANDEASPTTLGHLNSASNVENKIIDDDNYEDEEVDIDDLPSELKRDTLEQREREKAASSVTASKVDGIQRHLHEGHQHGQEQQRLSEVDELTRGDDLQQQPILWIYLDPQGNTQGPFSSTDMLDWFNAGYFPQDLMLRRNIDRRFIQLGDMTKRYGRIPFIAAGNVPPPLLEVELQQPPPAPAEQEEKQRHQQALIYQQQLQHQLLVNQQLMQQQQLFLIQQQQQGTPPATLAMAAQQLADHQKQQQTLLAKLMQLQLTLMSPQQPLMAPPQMAKEFSSSPSPLDFVSPLELVQQRPPQQQQQQQHPVSAPFEIPKPAEIPRQLRNEFEFGTGFGGSAQGNGPTGNVSYDPIKSLLSQLQETSTNEQPPSSIYRNSPDQRPGSSGSGFSGFNSVSQQQQQQNSRPGSSHQTPEFSEPVSHSTRSIWDMPVSSLREEESSPEPKVGFMSGLAETSKILYLITLFYPGFGISNQVH